MQVFAEIVSILINIAEMMVIEFTETGGFFDKANCAETNPAFLCLMN